MSYLVAIWCPMLYLMVICSSTTSMCLQTACSLLQLAKWSLPGKAVERRGRGSVLARGWVLAKLPSVHGHGQLLSTPSRIPIDTAAPIWRTVYPTGRPSCDWAADDITLQWDTLSLSAVTLEGKDRYIRSQSWFWELKSQDPETAPGLLR